jgi:hypothetical protein
MYTTHTTEHTTVHMHAHACRPTYICTHTFTSHSNTYHFPLNTIATCTFTSLPRITHTLSLSLPSSISHSRTHIHTTYTYTYTHTHTHTHTHTFSLSLLFTHTHTHQHTHTSTQRKQRHLASGPDHLSGECISLCGGGLTATVTAGWCTGDVFPGL